MDEERRGRPTSPDPAAVGIAALVTVGCTLALWVLLGAIDDWADRARQATCLTSRCFCEAVRPGLVAQPANTVSSLVYVALGAWVLARVIRGASAPGSSRVLIPAAALATCAVGLSSAFFHATLTFLGQYLDVLSMYLLGALILCGALWRRGSIDEGAGLALFVGLAVGLGVAQYVEPELRRVLFAVVLVPGIVLECTARVHGLSGRDRRLRPLFAGVALMAVAYVLWILDQSGALCWPDSLVQGHAAWHTLGAVAALLLVVHYARTPRSIRT